MAERRYRLIVVDQHHAVHGHAVDLPDAEHIHLTRRPDGSIASAVPMVLAIPEHDEPGDADAWWVDAPEQGNDRQALSAWSARIDSEPDDLTTEAIVEAIREQRGPLPEPTSATLADDLHPTPPATT